MSLSALTVQQLRYLVALDRHCNFGDAANACHVSQPALSTQVKKVEELQALVSAARAYLEGAIRHAPGLGAGQGPLNHFWRLY